MPIEGLQSFITGSQKLLFGKDNPLIQEGRIATAQVLSGTGALRHGCDIIKQEIPSDFLVPDPTWLNHLRLIKYAGLNYQYYQYYDNNKKGLALPQILDRLSKARPGTPVLMHMCAHNPTGCDPSHD